MCGGYQAQLQVAGLVLQLKSDQSLREESRYLPFLKEIGYTDYIIRFQMVEELPPTSCTVVHEDVSYRICRKDDGSFVHVFLDPPRDDTPYAVATYDYDNGIIQVEYLKKGAHCVSELSNSFGHINFEELLLRKQRLCLHASCVDTPYGGILFSGQSGIGKSTQSDLWCQYRGAKLINGDRPILSREGDRWLAWGSPYAGSSKCHINESCTVRAVVMLRQGADCSVRKLNATEAFRKVWSGLTVHSWDASFVTAACDLAQELIEAVPVYELTCTPDESAVLCLEDVLRKECVT